MDFNLSLVIAIVCVVSAASFILINKFFRRKSFDEIIAEKKALAYNANRKTSKTAQNLKKEMKKDKKRQQKEKQKEQQHQDSDGQQSETHSESAVENNNTHKPDHIEFEPEPEMITEENIAQNVAKSKKQKKPEKKQSGILTNKNSEVHVAKENDSSSANQLNHFDVKQPKDVVELKKQQIKEVKKVAETLKETKQQQVAEESPKNQPKKKNDKKSKEKENINILEAEINGVNGLMKLFTRADLNRSETQILIDYLLNKQQDMSESNSNWSDDIAPKLKKEIEQAQKDLLEERISSKAIQKKLQDLRSDYNNQKNRMNEVTKKHNEILENREAQINVLQEDIQKLKEQFNAEREQYKNALQHQRQQAVSTQDLHAQITQLQNELTEKTNQITELQQKHLLQVEDAKKQSFEQAHQQQSEIIASLEKALKESELNAQKLASEFEKAKSMASDLENSKVEIRNLENALKSKTTELEKTIEEQKKETQKNASNEEEILKSLKTELKTAHEKIDFISKEKTELSKESNTKYSQLEKEKNELVKRLDNEQTELKKYKQIIGEKESAIANFEMSAKKREQDLLQQISEQKDKNNHATASGKNSGSEEEKLRQLLQRICPEAVKKHANTALSLSFDQWVEQVLNTHSTINSCSTNNSLYNHNNGDLSNNVSNSKSSSKTVTTSSSSTNTNGQSLEDMEKLRTENTTLKQEKAQLRAQVEEFKKIVANTDNMLNNLHTKAQQEADTFKSVVRAKNEEIDFLKNSNGHQ